MARLLDRHGDALRARLEPDETLVDAGGAIVSRRRQRGGRLPRGAFILAVTDRRLVALATSTWRLTPGEVLTSWRYDDGARIARAPFGRLRLVLPNRSVVTLSPYGNWSLTSLAAAAAGPPDR